MASQWKSFEETADVYPNVEYRLTRSKTARKDHKEYVGIIRPLKDEFWHNHTPPLAWNCKCWLSVTDKEPTDIPDNLPPSSKGLGQNAAISQQLFKDNHPYFTRVPKEAHQQIKTWQDYQTEELKPLRKRTLDTARTAFAGTKVFRKEINADIQISVSSIKETINQNHDHKREQLFVLAEYLIEALQNAEYIGEETPKHPSLVIVKYHKFRISIGGKDSFLLVQERTDGSYIFYDITDK